QVISQHHFSDRGFLLSQSGRARKPFPSAGSSRLLTPDGRLDGVTWIARGVPGTQFAFPRRGGFTPMNSIRMTLGGLALMAGLGLLPRGRGAEGRETHKPPPSGVTARGPARPKSHPPAPPPQYLVAPRYGNATKGSGGTSMEVYLG